MDWTPKTALGAPYHRSAEAMAVGVANTSPCEEEEHGAVVVTSNHQAVFRGHNGPPAGVSCTAGDTCRSTCRARSVHAEARAIHLAGHQARGSELVHVKVVNGALVTSGRPSCGQCAKAAMDAGIAGVWLYHQFEDGPRWYRYRMAEFHALSLVGEEERAVEGRIRVDELIRQTIDNEIRIRNTEREYLRHAAGCAEGESLLDAIVRLRAVTP